jgi:hypothetical protein
MRWPRRWVVEVKKRTQKLFHMPHEGKTVSNQSAVKENKIVRVVESETPGYCTAV